MDEIATRLKDTSAECLAALEAWEKDKKDREAREVLNDSVHELRKVASRLEIEMAVSERNEMAQKPIPVPAHRDARKRGGDDNRGNRAPKGDGGSDKPRQRRSSPKKAAGGEG